MYGLFVLVLNGLIHFSCVEFNDSHRTEQMESRIGDSVDFICVMSVSMANQHEFVVL